MLNIERDIATYLASQGLGTLGGTSATGWNVYASAMPDTPYNVICVYDLWGRPNHTLVSYRGCNFKFYIRIRGNTPDLVLTKANAVYDLLKFNPLITVGANIYRNIIADTNIQNAGREKTASGEKPVMAMSFSGLYNE